VTIFSIRANHCRMHPDCRCRLFALGRAELGQLPPPRSSSFHRRRSAPLRAVADEHGLPPQKGRGAVQPRTVTAVAVSSPSGRARRAALGPVPHRLRRSSAAAASLRCWWSPTSTASVA
jgi:hypothetical protein